MYRRIENIRFSGGWNTQRIFGIKAKIGVHVQVDFDADTGISELAGEGIGGSCEIELSASGMAGPIPVTAAIYGQATASVAAGITLSADASLHVSASARSYGLPPAMLLLPALSFSNPSVKFSASAGAQASASIGVGVKAGLGSDGIASATVNFTNSLNFSARPGGCSVDAKFGAFSVEGELLGWDIQSPKTPALFSQALWHNPCGAVGGSPGGPGGGGSGGSGGSGAPASAVAAGVGDNCALLTTGQIDCWGGNSAGELGDGSITQSGCGCASTPVTVAAITNATQVSGTCALLRSGTVECWGPNHDGQLGDGTSSGPQTCGGQACSTVPVPVSGLTNVNEVSTGQQQACALTRAADIYCWGDNSYGQLGNGTTDESDVPIRVPGIADATKVSVGTFDTCAVLSGGQVDCWGQNYAGELGDGSTGPDTCTGGYKCSTTPVQVSGIDNATSVSVGLDSACALLITGEIDCWGINEFGQLGNGTTTGSEVPVQVSDIDDASEISVGGNEACALVDGGALCWGENDMGELGDGTNTGPETCYDGDGCSTVPAGVDLSGAAQISVGSLQACALASDGEVDCWGWNADGDLGDGTTSNSGIPVEVSGIP